MRWLHVYLSLFSFVVLLFFGATGITLNHPSWTFGGETTTSRVDGILPSQAFGADGSTEFLVVSEYLRSDHGVGGEVTDFGENLGEGFISYKGAGYGAEAFFDTGSGAFSLTVQQQGFVAVMNDLHKGRDTPGLWRAIIDISGALLVVVALTGLGIQLMMRKRRVSGLTWAGIGLIATVAFIWIAMV